MRTEGRTRSRTSKRPTPRDNPEKVPAPSPGIDKLLLEDASFVLLETSDKILLE